MLKIGAFLYFLVSSKSNAHKKSKAMHKKSKHEGVSSKSFIPQILQASVRDMSHVTNRRLCFGKERQKLVMDFVLHILLLVDE